MQAHALADHLAVLAASLGLLPNDVLLFMAPDCRRGLVRVDVGGGLVGNARVVGAVLVLALLAGLTPMSIT